MNHERYDELNETYIEANPNTRTTRPQRLVSASAFYLQSLSPFDVVWGQDVTKWLALKDPNDAVNTHTTANVFNRLAEQGLTIRYREQFYQKAHRPPRIYHQLTELGTAVAIHRIQELRANEETRPSWMIVPERNDGRFLPTHPDGFEISQPDGILVAEIE